MIELSVHIDGKDIVAVAFFAVIAFCVHCVFKPWK